MKERLQFLFIYFTFWVVYFLSARLIFLGYHIDQTKLLTLDTLFGVFFHGIRMDFSMAGYLSLIPFFLVSVSNFIKKSIFEGILYGYTFIIVCLVTLVIVVDLQVYNVWDYRLDATPLNYLKTPKEAWASVRSSPIFQLFLSFLLLMILAAYIVYRVLANNINNWNYLKPFPFTLIAFIISFSLIIPIRGGFGIAPMNQSTVYFSNQNFANIAAVNASWNFFSSLVNHTYTKTNPYTYLPRIEVERNFKQLFSDDKKQQTWIDVKEQQPNVLIIVWESFSAKVVDLTKNGVAVSPNFNRLKNESLYFSNVYASGDRTDKGLVAILSAYPSQPTYSIIKEPHKAAKLPVLTQNFDRQGYNTEFYYGGETEFANIKSYLFTADFNKIVDINDFPEDSLNTEWGVHDELIFEKFLNDHSFEKKDPFFATILTLSSHEPYDVPGKKFIEGDDEESLYLNAIHYTDQQLDLFLKNAKKQTWWNNTLVIIIGDHGHRLPITGDKTDNFKTPMLWTGGVVSNHQKINKTASQVDLAATLLSQLNLPANYPFSKNISSGTQAWAYFCFNDGFGFVNQKGHFLFDNVGRKIIRQTGKISPIDISYGKALQQRTFQDYLDK